MTYGTTKNSLGTMKQGSWDPFYNDQSEWCPYSDVYVDHSQTDSSYTPNKLFIGGISAHTTTELLREHFNQYGRIIDSVVMQRNGRPRGFGFVTFDNLESVDRVLAEAQWLDGRLVDVKRAVPEDRGPDRSANKIFVGGLPQGVTTDDLKDYFSRYGPITDAVVMLDRRTNRSRGFGFIRFGAGPGGTHAAEDALTDFYGHYIDGKWIEVKRATPQEMTQGSGMSGDGMSDMYDGPMDPYGHHGDVSTPHSSGSNSGTMREMMQEMQPRSHHNRRKRSGAARPSRDSRKGSENSYQGDMGWEHHVQDHENHHGYYPEVDSHGMDIEHRENDQNQANIEFLLRGSPMKLQPSSYGVFRHQDESEFTRDDFLSLEVGPWRSPLQAA